MSKLEKWAEMSSQLKQLKEQEATLRRELCSEIIGDNQMVNGRVTVKGMEHHLEYTAVQSLSFRLDARVLDTLWNHLTDADKLAIVHKPSLSLAVYKKLDEGSLLHEAVITSLAMPTLKVEVNDGY